MTLNDLVTCISVVHAYEPEINFLAKVCLYCVLHYLLSSAFVNINESADIIRWRILSNVSFLFTNALTGRRNCREGVRLLTTDPMQLPFKCTATVHFKVRRDEKYCEI